MNNIIQILLSTVVALSFAGSAAASSVSFKNVTAPILNPVCSANINLVNCIANPDLNEGKCEDLSYTNPLWGVGQQNMTWSFNGAVSGPNGVYVAPPPIGSENPKNIVNVSFTKNADTTPLDPFFGTGPISFYVVPTCVNVEQDNQGGKRAVVRGIARLTLFPGFVVEEPELWLITQDQDGRDRIAISAAADGTKTTCTFEDAANSVTNPQAVGLPPNPPEFTTDNLFELLSPTTKGSITPKK